MCGFRVTCPVLLAVLSLAGCSSGATPDAGTPGVATTGLERVNFWRTSAGLPAVQKDTKVQSAAAAHAHFVATNPQSCWPGGHTELDQGGCPGFTGAAPQDRLTHAGYDWGVAGEAIDFQEPDQVAAVDRLVWLVYHRLIVLSPTVSDAGFAAEGGVNVLDVAAPLSSPVTPPSTPVLFPSKGMTGVPYSWSGRSESPEPPPPSTGWPSGPPISVRFPSAQWQVSQATLSGTEGPRPVVMLTPQTDSTLASFSMQDFFFYAETPLTPSSTYTATVQGTLDGQPWSQTWTFTTQGQ